MSRNQKGFSHEGSQSKAFKRTLVHFVVKNPCTTRALAGSARENKNFTRKILIGYARICISSCCNDSATETDTSLVDSMLDFQYSEITHK